MSTTKAWSIGAVLLVAVVVALGWFLGISPKLEESALARGTLAEIQAANAVHEQELALIKKQFDGIGELRSELVDLQGSVPEGANLSALFSQLNSLAESRQVSFTNFTASEAQVYAPLTEAAVPVPEEAPAETDTEAEQPAERPAPVSTQTDASGAPSAPAPVISPLITADNFVAITITMEVSGGESNVLAFLEGVQSTERLVLVSDFSTTRSGTSEFTARITGIIYALVDPSASSTAGSGLAAG